MKNSFKALALAMLVSTSAHAEFISGNDLYERLRDPSARQYGLGYIAGVHDVFGGASICLPRGATLGQIADVVRDYLAANPSLRHYAADSIVITVLTSVYPCANNTKKGSSL